MQEKILDILNEIKDDVDFSASTSFIQDGLLTSIDIIMLVSELSESFDITISAREVIPDNFKSVDSICEMVNRLREDN